jgi:hypothetical protein
VDKPWKHAVGDPRGSDIAVTSGLYKEARFGVMFKDLPGHALPDGLLRDLAAQMGEPAGATGSRDSDTDRSGRRRNP